MTEHKHQLPWGKLLVSLSRDLREDQLKEAWVCARSHLPQSNAEAKSSWLDMFAALQEAGMIDMDNTSYLKKLLADVGADAVSNQSGIDQSVVPC